MLRLFCGWESREAFGFQVFAHSVIARASKPLAIIPLASMGLPEGSNAFTYSRFLVPSICEYQGHAIFADASDMLMRGDVAELDALFDPQYAVQVVKHSPYKTKHRIKYKGTVMECPNLNYERKNWASLMLVNCEHPKWREVPKGLDALQFKWLDDSEIGEIPAEWNRLVDEGHTTYDAKVLHWTAGLPGFAEYNDAPGAYFWHRERAELNRV